MKTQFRIKSILAFTLVVAFVIAFRHWLLIALASTAFFAYCAFLTLPIAIFVASFICGLQGGKRKDIRAVILLLVRVWLACTAIVFVLWLVGMLFLFTRPW